MDDLISRQAAIKLLEEWAGGYSYLEVPVSSIAPKLNELPTAGTIIRCDECEYWDIEWIPAGGEGHYCPMMDNVMMGDEWCCYAERKSDG